MKAIFNILVLTLAFSTAARAGFAPTYSCSNKNATVKIDMYGVTILATTYPKDVVLKFGRDEISTESKDIQAFPAEVYGCSSRTVELKFMTLSLKNGQAMPDAYNQIARDGKLSDYYICTTDHAWMPAPGQSCF